MLVEGAEEGWGDGGTLGTTPLNSKNHIRFQELALDSFHGTTLVPLALAEKMLPFDHS